VPELIRGKTGRVNGHLVALLTLMKGQPLAYNKDNQEDKEPLFDTLDTVRDSLIIMTDLTANIVVKPDNMRHAVMKGFATATDLADYLVKKGMAFRDAHEAVATAVRVAGESKRGLEELSLTELQQFSPLIGDDVYQMLTPEGSAALRDHIGGTAPAQVKAAVVRARLRLK
jgi:argininosuccinate lyase